jgi:outer membrane lipoprotein
MIRLFFIVIYIQSVMLSACAQSAHQTGRDALDRALPSELRNQIDSTVAFPDLQTSPSHYIGRTVMFSGIVLKTRLAKDHTEIEILELASGAGVPPPTDRTRSEGRFIAIEKSFLDPATMESGRPVTVVGTVSGADTRPLDESDYTYPVIEITRLLDWNNFYGPDGPGFNPYGYYGGYYQPYPYWGGGYGAYGYGWGPYYPFFFGGPPVAPAPPPTSVPPQFRNRR